MRRRAERAFTLVELLAVLAIVSLAAGLVLARLPDADRLALHETAARMVERLSAARERAILEGRPVRIDVRDGMPAGVRVDGDSVAGDGAVTAIDFAPEGDALPRRLTLVDESGGQVGILVPAGFARAQLVREVAP